MKLPRSLVYDEQEFRLVDIRPIIPVLNITANGNCYYYPNISPVNFNRFEELVVGYENLVVVTGTLNCDELDYFIYARNGECKAQYFQYVDHTKLLGFFLEFYEFERITLALARQRKLLALLDA